MELAQYKVRSIGWCDGEFDDDSYSVSAFGAGGVVQSWCEWMESNSNFCEGYPDGHVVEVLHPDNSRTHHTICTDFDPHYVIFDTAV